MTTSRSNSHAILSPSAAHRWLNCSAAPSLEMGEPEQTSIYAEEGTLAHAICEAKLRAYISGKKAEDIYKDEHGKYWADDELYSAEMEECSDYYRDIVTQTYEEAKRKTPDAKLLIEVPLDLSMYIPEGYGTSDAVIISDSSIEVIDYKHGEGVKVDAYRNPQMMIYALGAYSAFSFEYNLSTVKMTIVQPRLDNVSVSETPSSALIAWGKEVLKPKAKEAYEGTLGCKTIMSVGKWCQFCKVRKKCKARADEALALAEQGDPRLLTPEQLPDYLLRAESVKGWCNDIIEYATGLLIEGTHIDGYKLVEGRSVRKITNPDGLADALSQYVSKDILYRPLELKTLSDLEKIVGKKIFAEVSGEYIEKPSGKPTLAKATDKRKEYSSTAADFTDAIKNLN